MTLVILVVTTLSARFDVDDAANAFLLMHFQFVTSEHLPTTVSFKEQLLISMVMLVRVVVQALLTVLLKGMLRRISTGRPANVKSREIEKLMCKHTAAPESSLNIDLTR